MSSIYVKGIKVSHLEPQKKGADGGYINLAIAIVQLACHDYRILRRRLVRERNERERSIIESRMHEIEMFFKSAYGITNSPCPFVMQPITQTWGGTFKAEEQT